MAIVITPDSELGKEMAKWNKPYQYRPFPKMLYKAQKRPDGVPSVGEARDSAFGGNPGEAEAFSKTCQMLVNDETELTRYVEMGWREGPTEALEFFEEREKAFAESAAQRAHGDRNMGDKAKAEAAAVEASTPEHVAEVPRTPVRRRGRPKGSKNKKPAA